MKKLLIAVGIIIGFALCAYAQDASEFAKQVATELQNARVITAQEASSVESSVKALIESGATTHEAKIVVSQAARQAKASGLKGKDLAAKVKEAASARKAQLYEAKKKAKKEMKAMKKELKDKKNVAR